ncbi:MAG TPA: ABC transporter ATP-binding protein [Methanoregulaceae archaeon]|nr:ABC transporter ATP-binding protein [Methanoregulaceae archaeon]HQJ87832.1 ABC transporter ATP-binding protein [Methanoregulaceae archaeon]
MIRCERVGWEIEGKTVLDDISLTVGQGEVLGLIGPSGSGKSSLIRIMDLLVTPTSGRLWIDSTEVTAGRVDLVGLRRRMGIVFHRPAVFSGDVRRNVSIGLGLRGIRGDDARLLVEETLEMVGLAGFGPRRASSLSGGELQRVAIARSLVTRPTVLFLDEPTANLDPLSTRVVEDVVRKARSDLGTTIVMATHDLDQGQRLCDRLAVMAAGRLVQVGSPPEIFYRPGTSEVARFVGAGNLVEGTVERMDRGVAFVRTTGGLLAVAVHAPVSGTVTVAIRPEEIVLSRGPAGPAGSPNHLSCRVTGVDTDGPLVRVHLDCGFPLIALVRRLTFVALALEPGQEVSAAFDPNGAHLIARA